MSIVLKTLVTLLIHFATDASTQFMPQNMPFPFPQHGSMMSMANQMPQMSPLGHMPMPMQMPMQLPMQQQRMPMVVMPHHKPRSKKTHRKKRKHFKRESASSDESFDSDDVDFRTKNKFRSRGKRRRQVLTPVVSYVTKDGYVVYQKKIKKERAKDRLEMGKGEAPNSKMIISIERDRD